MHLHQSIALFALAPLIDENRVQFVSILSENNIPLSSLILNVELMGILHYFLFYESSTAFDHLAIHQGMKKGS